MNAPRPLALVTGASSGIGADLARLLAADGHDLALVARRVERLDELARELAAKHGVTAETISCDLAEVGATDWLAEEMSLRDRPVDVLVNNAGFGLKGAFVDTDPVDERRMLQLNVVALTDLTKLILPGMVKRGRGRVLNVASTAGFMPGPFMAVYYATKAYVLSFSEALSEEVRGTGVTVTVLAPGAVRSEFPVRAGTGRTRLFRRRGVMDPAPVARAGYEAMKRGEMLVIPGLINRLRAHAPRIAPRWLMPRAVKGYNLEPPE